ncbi:hypothetical protein ACKWTF_014704 [Chironomus riparius]
MDEQELDKVLKEINKNKKWYQKISVEPTIFLYIFAFSLTSVIENVFYVYKSCTVNHNYSHEICMEIEKHDEIKTAVQATTAKFLQYDSIAGQIIPIILALFIGSFADRRGRKLPLLLGLIGKLIYSSMIIVNSLMPNWPVENIIYTATIPGAITGGDIAIFASALAFLTDITTEADRTVRISILGGAYVGSIPVAVLTGTYLYNFYNKSFTKMFVTNAVLIVLSILYTVVKLDWQTTPKQVSLTTIPKSQWISDFFDKKHFKQTVRTVTKKRDNNYRLYIILMMVSVALYAIQRSEQKYFFLFAQNKLSWTTEIYSYFRTFESASYVFGILVAVPIFSKVFKWKDTVIVVIGACGSIIGRLFFAFVGTTALMYVGASFASVGPIILPALRSISSKLVPCDERGIMFALISACDKLVPIISGVLYSQTYLATMKVYPAGIFWVTIVSQALVFVTIIFIHFNKRDTDVQGEFSQNNDAMIENCVDKSEILEK